MKEKDASAARDGAAPAGPSGGPSAGSSGVGRALLGWVRGGALVFLCAYCFVVLNLILYRHPWRIDLTAERLHTLSEETRKRLETVEEEIVVIVPFLFREDARAPSLVFQRARELLNQYVAYQPRIRVEGDLNLASQQDGMRWVELRNAWGLADVQVNHFIFIVRDDPRLKQVLSLADLAEFQSDPPRIDGFHAEAAFTSAITRLARRERKRIVIAQDWGAPSLADKTSTGLFALEQALEAAGYDASAADLIAERGVPASCDLLIVAGPERPVSAAARQRIQDYLGGGGKLLLLLGQSETGLEKVIEEWNIQAPRGRVYQKQQFLGGVADWSPFVLGVKTNPAHPATRAFPPGGFQILGRNVRALEIGYKDGVTATMLFSTPQSAVGTPAQIFIDRNGNRTLDAGEDSGDAIWGAVADRAMPARPPPRYRHVPTRLVVIGDVSPWTNGNFDRFSHRDLLLNSVRWLLEDEREIGVSSQPYKDRNIKWSPEIASFLFWVPIALFPGIVLCFGVFVFYARRV